MSIGIIGAGSIGSALATILGRAMIPAVIANSRGPESLKALTGELGPAVTAGTVEQAAAQDIVIVAVPWSKLPGALAGLDLGGKIVIDANNPIEAPLFKPADLRGRVSSAVFAELVPGARVVKAFNLLLQVVNQTALRDRMIGAIRYDFTRDYDDGLAKADAWLAEQPFEGFVFKGDMGEAHIRSVRVAPEGFLVEADATATAAMTHNPRRAAQLVAERRAKKAAKERAKALEAAKAAN